MNSLPPLGVAGLQHGNVEVVALGRVSAQRILALQSIGKREGDVRAGVPDGRGAGLDASVRFETAR